MYHNLFKSKETITEAVCRKKGAHDVSRCETILLLHDYSRPYVVGPIKTFLETPKSVFYSTRGISQSFPFATITCSDQWLMVFSKSTSHHMKVL